MAAGVAYTNGDSLLEQFRSDAIQDCYRRAAEARRTANSASNADDRSDFLELERRWLALARSFDSEGLGGTPVTVGR
jgi:hypothetical protein